MTATATRARRGGPAIFAALGFAAPLLAGCSTSAHQATPSAAQIKSGLGTASAGALSLSGGYIPEPASPDVAAAYLTITNTGTHTDRVTAVTTNVTTTVMAMQENTHGDTTSMTDLANVTVPAHGAVTLSPGREHLMLQHPTRALHTGDSVTMTVTFARAGRVVITLPVVPITGPTSVGAS